MTRRSYISRADQIAELRGVASHLLDGLLNGEYTATDVEAVAKAVAGVAETS
jgi:hypothetical protein